MPPYCLRWGNLLIQFLWTLPHEVAAHASQLKASSSSCLKTWWGLPPCKTHVPARVQRNWKEGGNGPPQPWSSWRPHQQSQLYPKGDGNGRKIQTGTNGSWLISTLRSNTEVWQAAWELVHSSARAWKDGASGVHIKLSKMTGLPRWTVGVREWASVTKGGCPEGGPGKHCSPAALTTLGTAQHWSQVGTVVTTNSSVSGPELLFTPGIHLPKDGQLHQEALAQE